MQRNTRLPIVCVLLLAGVPLAASAQTVFFNDNFSNGSTTNQLSIPGGTPSASFTSYDFASSKNSTRSSIGPDLLSCRLAEGTTSGYWEVQALFAVGANVVSLNAPGDYVEMTIVFTNSLGTLLQDTNDELWMGLYNSASSPTATNTPVPGALANGGLNTTPSSPYATGNCQLWSGYACRIFRGAGSRIFARPVQNGSGTASSNQELVGNGVSGGTFNNPAASGVYTGPSQTYAALDTSSPYTLVQRITLNPNGAGSLIISNALFSGAGTGGTLLMSNATTVSTVVAIAFDGLAFGALNKGASANPQMDVAYITITGQSSPPIAPLITSEPSPVAVATGGSCAFTVEATGNNLTYQWHRNGTNLINGGNISGATSPMLVISPAGTADALSGGNGYYVTVTGAGNLSTNSVTVSLTLRTAASLIYSGGGPWDVNTSASWLNTSLTPGFYFNYGDSVMFDDNGGGGNVTLTGPYLSAASVTVDHSLGFYTFQGSGSFAGPGSLTYKGSAQLTINNANSYSGGTLISNASANLRLGNLNGLGTGPITLAQAGGQMQILVGASASTGINSDLIVADDFTFVVEPIDSAYAVVLRGNLSGTAGKTLTFNHGTLGSGTSVTRIRALGANTVYDANLNLNDSTFLWACYQASGSQTYNGVISGTGALMQKENTTYLNGANTYAGGTTPAAGAIGLGIDSVGDPVASGPIGTGPLLLINDSTTSLTGSGTIFASGGPRTIANLIQYPKGSNNLTLVIGGTNSLTLSGAVTLQGNDGGGAGTNRIFQADAFTTLSGVISDGGLGVGLTKTGTNVLVLSNDETYTGPTTVSAGTLQVNGSLAAGSAVTVATNGTLGGTGTVGGSVTVNAGGAIAPGASIGTLSIGGNLGLAGNLKIEVNKSASPPSDKVALSGALNVSATGAITVTNLGPALAKGDSFPIFASAVANGGSLPVTGANMVWTNKLAVNGTIEVLSGVAAPVTISQITHGGIFYGGGLGTEFVLLQSPSVAPASWTPVMTNTATPGVFPIIVGGGQLYFRILSR